MCKKVSAVYFLLSKGQHEEGQKAGGVVDSPVASVCEKDAFLQRGHKYQSPLTSDFCDSGHATAATDNSVHILL